MAKLELTTDEAKLIVFSLGYAAGTGIVNCTKARVLADKIQAIVEPGKEEK